MIKAAEIMARDPNWPVCTCDSWVTQRWCDHIGQLLKNGEDVLPTEAAIEFAVPYLPQLGVFATAAFGPEINPDNLPGVRRLFLLRHKPLRPDVTYEDMGIWSPGEGRASICLTIRDWAHGHTVMRHLTCPCTVHGYKQNQLISRMDESQLQVNDFYILTENACWFCYHTLTKAAAENDGTFLDPTDNNTPGLQQLNQQVGRRY